MVFRFISRLLGILTNNENLINRLAESKPIRRAAQLTVYSIVKAEQVAKKSVDEFQRAGGAEKLKQVARSDLNEGTKLAKEMITYDIPNLIRKIWTDLRRK